MLGALRVVDLAGSALARLYPPRLRLRVTLVKGSVWNPATLFKPL